MRFVWMHPQGTRAKCGRARLRKMRTRTLARAPVCRRVHPCAVPMAVDWRAGVSSSRLFIPKRWLSPPLAWIALPCDSPRVETAIFPTDL